MALYNLCKVYTTTPGTGPVNPGAPVPGFLSFQNAGVVNGAIVSYAIFDPSIPGSEVGTGTYTLAGNQMTRTVVKSTNADAALNLSGNAIIAITPLVTDIAITAGTLMLFQQTTAPSGWTKQTTHNDKALRIVSGTASSGGSIAFSTCFGRTTTDGYTITHGTMPSHNHPGTWYADPSGGSYGGVYGGPTAPVGTMIALEGSSQPHTHGFDIRVQYADCIIALRQ